MAKMIYVYGKTREEAEEYIRNCVKPITDVRQLRGHDTNTAVLLILSREESITGNARIRKLAIIKA